MKVTGTYHPIVDSVPHSLDRVFGFAESPYLKLRQWFREQTVKLGLVPEDVESHLSEQAPRIIATDRQLVMTTHYLMFRIIARRGSWRNHRRVRNSIEQFTGRAGCSRAVMERF